jgi:hypothetical protein
MNPSPSQPPQTEPEPQTRRADQPLPPCVSAERLTVDPAASVVVFLIGMRVNHWWMLPTIWAVAAAMGRMMAELSRKPEAGLLSYESYAGRTTLALQYWRSLDDLQRYAHAKENQHVPAWRRWLQRTGLDGAIGIWHETYLIGPGQHECVYVHMPAFGLGAALPRIPAVGTLKTARGRLDVGRLAHLQPAAP